MDSKPFDPNLSFPKIYRVLRESALGLHASDPKTSNCLPKWRKNVRQKHESVFSNDENRMYRKQNVLLTCETYLMQHYNDMLVMMITIRWVSATLF